MTEHNLGLTALLSNHPRESINHFDRAIQLDPKFWETYLERSRAYIEIDQVPKALADLNSYFAGTSAPSITAFTRRGYCYSVLGDLKRAIDDYTVAIQMDPKYPQTYGWRGQCYERLGRSDLAQKDYTVLVSLGGQKPAKIDGAFVFGGSEKDVQRQVKAAPAVSMHLRKETAAKVADDHLTQRQIQELNDQLAKDPSSLSKLSSRALLYRKIREYGKALADYQTLIGYASINPSPDYSMDRIRLEYADLLASIGRYDEALTHLKAIGDNSEKKAERSFAIAECDLKLGRYQDAITAYTDCLSSTPKSPGKVYRRRAQAYAGIGDNINSIDDLKKAEDLGE